MQAAIVLTRGLHLAGMLSFLGTAAFRVLMLPAAASVSPPLRARLGRLAWISLAVALVAGVGWLTFEAGSMADAVTSLDALRALPLVASATRYGQVMMGRLGLLLLAGLALAWPNARQPASWAVLALSGLAAAMQGLLAHAGAAEGADTLLVSEALHVPAAGIWFGALLPLWLSIATLAPKDGAAVCERFTPVGLACVLVIAASGVIQALSLVGSVPGLLGTEYGRIVLLKTGLFVVALMLALLNRLWLTDRLAMLGRARGLRLSVAVEALLGCAIVLAAGWLASGVPALHEQPVWPLSWQFSLETVNEDDEFRAEVITSLLMIGGAVLVFAGSLFIRGRVWRHARWAAAALVVAAAVWRGPSLSLLTVEAYPTSFQSSPTGFSVASILAGQQLYPGNCAACHGVEGRGDGPAAAALRIKPANLTAAHVLGHSDGEMIWWLGHGIGDPDGGVAMPGFASKLSEGALWSLIDYVRAHNAGAAIARGAMPPVPVRAPDFPLACRGAQASDLADLHGHALLILAGAAAGAPPPIPVRNNVSAVTIALRGGAGAAKADCTAESGAAWGAYAVLAGTRPDDLAGATFLVDPNGWLRAVHWSGAPLGWHTDAELVDIVRAICANPIDAASGGEHAHHH